MAKRKPDPERDRADAYICLFCEKETCSGADQCFKEQKKKRAREYQADRRAAQRALDRFYREQYARDRWERLKEAKEDYDRKRAAQ